MRRLTIPARLAPQGLIASACAFALAACGGGSTGSLPAANAGNGHGVKATLHLVIGGPHRHRVHRRGRGTAPRFVSPSTDGVLVQVYAHGAARIPANVIASAAVNVSSGSAACGGMTGYPRACSATMFLQPTGATLDDVIVGSYDQAPVSGAIPGGAHVLGLGALLNQAIVAATNNALNVFLGGVIDSLGGNPAYLQMPADGGAHTVTLVIDPEDFGNNPISGGASDPFANPIVVSTTETGGSGHVSITVNGGTPQQQVTLSKTSDLSNVVLHYDGKSPAGYALSATLNAPSVGGSGGATSTVLVTTLALSSTSSEYAPGALALKGNGDLLTLTIGESNAPSTPTYTVTPASCNAIAEPLGLTQASGSGSVLVFARGMSSASGCTITVSDGTSSIPVAVSNTYSGIEGTPTIAYFSAAGISPTAMTEGPDAKIWFAAVASIGSITATGASPVATSYPLPTSLNTPTNTNGLTTGPDGNLWYAANATTSPQMLVGAFSASAHTGTQYQTTFAGFPFGIVPGPDGNLWFAQLRDPGAQNAIGKVTTGGTFANFTLSPTDTNQEVHDIVTGPDGNLWFTEACEPNVGQITTGGTIVEYPVTATGTGTYDITVGSDGALWYTDGFQDWGRITTSGTSTYGMAGLTGGDPQGITTGPDGAIWFVETGAGAGGIYYIGRVDPSNNNALTEISLGTTKPTGPIVAGPDGALWFASGANVGRIALQTSAASRHKTTLRAKPR